MTGAGKKFSACSTACKGIAETRSLVPGATGVAYYLFSSLPKNCSVSLYSWFKIFLLIDFLGPCLHQRNFADYFSFSAIRSSTTETVCLGSVMRFDALLWHVFAVLFPLLLLCRILVCVADRRTFEDEQRLW